MTQAKHILVVEDDREIRDLMTRHLGAQGWRVSAVPDGTAMDRVLAADAVDLVILDIMLPGEDGLSLCRRLSATIAVPTIIVSARGEEFDRILGLEIGADDYLAKPFSPRELTARIKALFRRLEIAGSSGVVRRRKLTFEGWLLDMVLGTVTNPDGVQVTLTPAEIELLRVFCERPGQVLSRELLIELTRGHIAAPSERSVDILVSRLRQKLSEGGSGEERKYIRTVRSGGYEFVADVAF